MRKNSILALLATGVLPMSAFAAINIPGVATDYPNWDLTGVSDPTTAGGVITVPGSQSGYPSCTMENLPAGEYIISGTLENAKFVVLLNGTEIAVAADGTFTTTTAGNLLIEVHAIDKALSYSFGNVKLALNVDLAQIQADMQALLPTPGDITAPSVNMPAYVNADDNIKGSEVIAEYNALVAEKSTVETAVANIYKATYTDEQQLAAYIKFVNSNVEKQVKTYAQNYADYQDGITDDEGEYTKYPIATINTWADTLAQSIVDHNADLSKVPAKEKALRLLLNQIEEEGNTAALANEITKAKEALAAVKKAIDDNWNAAGVQVGKAAYAKVSFADLLQAISDLEDAAAALVDNQDRYTNYWLPKYEELTNEYINQQQAIKDLYKDEPGQQARQDSVMVALTEIFNAAVDQLETTYAEDGNGTCTLDQWNNDKPIIDAAIEAMQARVEEDTQALKDEQQALANGTDAVDGLKDALDAIILNDDAYDHEALANQLNPKNAQGIAGKVQALQDKIDAIYASTEVLFGGAATQPTTNYKAKDFADDVAALQAEIDALAAQVAVANQLGALTTDLNAARQAIADDENTVYLNGLAPEYAVNIVDKMSGSYNSVKEAIEQQQGIYDETTDFSSFKTSKLDKIDESINGDDGYKANGLAMAKAFADAYKIALPDLANAKALVNYIKNSNPAFNVKVTSEQDGVGVDLTNGIAQAPFLAAAQAMQTTAQEIVDGIAAARAEASPQNTFDAINDVMDQINTEDLATKIPAKKIEYLHDVIGAAAPALSNITELHKGLDDLANQMTAIATYAGYDAVEDLYNYAESVLTVVDTEFAAAATAEKPVDAYEAVNVKAKKVIADLQAVQNEIDKVVANYNAWKAVCDLYDTIADKADAADLYATKNSYEPARSSWIDEIAKKVAEGEDIKEALDEVYNNVEMLAKVDGKTNQQIYTEQVQDILDWFGVFNEAVEQNEAAHNNLLDESAYVTRLVDVCTDFMNKAQVDVTLEDGRNAADVLAEYIAELSDLDTELYNAYKGLDFIEIVKENGYKVNGTDVDSELMEKYEALAQKILDLQAELDSDYAKALKEYNEKFIQDNWNAVKADLMEIYTLAIEKLDAYQAVVEGCDLLANNDDVKDAVDHQPIYDYAPEIQQLIQDVKDMLNNSWPTFIIADHSVVVNDDQRKLTEDDLAAFLTRAQDIEDGITTTYNDKEEALLTAVEAVLDTEQTRVEDLINDVTDELTAAGCDAESIEACLKAANDALDLAALQAHVPLDGRYQPLYVAGVANAINTLAGVDVTDAQKVAAAQNTFNNAVEDKQEEINTATQTLKESSLPEAKKKAFETKISAAQDELNDVKNDDIDLDNLKEELAKVAAIDVATIQADIEQAIAHNEANNQAKDNLDGGLNDLQDALDALNDWVEKLIVAADVPTSQIEVAITNLQTKINKEYNDGTCDKHESDLQDEIDAIQADIDAAYADAYQKELTALDEELKQAQRAYNEAAAAYEAETGLTNYPETEEGIEYTEKIDEQALALGTAHTVTGTPTEAQQDAILDIQDALLQIQLDLGYLSNDIVIAQLDKIADTLIEAVNADKADLGNYAAEEYADDYDALVAEIEAVKAEYANNPSIIVQKGVYEKKLADLNDKLADLNAEAEAYQAEREANAAKEAASNAVYETLNADLQEVKDAADATQANIEKYADKIGDDFWAGRMALIQGQISDDEWDLEQAKEAFACVDFEWPYNPEEIASSIDDVDVALWNAVTTAYIAEAGDAISKAKDAVYEAGVSHVGQAALEARYTQLFNELNKLKAVTNGDAEAGEALVAAAEDLINRAELLFKDVVDSEFIPGDITHTGEITAADYKALIDLLGEIDDPTDFDDPAYDVNGDGKVTAADIATLIDKLMGVDSGVAVNSLMAPQTDNNAIYVVKGATNNGVTRYAIMLNNTADLFAAQMDIMLSDGMEIVTEGVAERASQSEFYASTTRSGNHRVILSSIEKNVIAGNDGAIVYIDVQGNGSLEIANVFGVDAQGRMYSISVMNDVSGIESISNDLNNADIYNVGGQKLNRMERGVNIIRGNDGKASKVYNK